MLKNCSAKTLASVACSIRRAINGIDERYCIQLGHLLNKSACGHVNLTISMVNTRNAFASTNHTRFEYYQVDFGKGSPALVRPAFLLFENGFVIMRAPPDVGGYELVFVMVPKVAKGMMESEYWKHICQSI
ncbi:hypothetical protein GGI11_001875 [Coemansia sp. RSA 2049]|nr:hypothetical protein GGI11_001875 [Coemansia sp. RSA 2049]